MKTILILILGSLSLSAGGVAMLHISDHNVLNLDVWTFAIKGFATIPDYMIDQAIRGDSPDLIRGLFVAVFGALLALIFTMVAMGIHIIQAVKIRSKRSASKKALKAEEKAARSLRKTEKKDKAAAEKESFVGRKVKSVTGYLKSIKPSQKPVFKDSIASLEDDEAEPKTSVIALIKEKISKITGKKKSLVIKTGSDIEAVVEIQDEGDFINDLKGWYRSIKSVSHDDVDKVQEARDLRSRASRRIRNQVIEEDAMNGEFMLRMMDAWAAKKDAVPFDSSVPIVMSDIEDKAESAGSFSRAIQDVMEQGVTASDDDEFALEDFDDEDDDFIIHDIDELEEPGYEDEFSLEDEVSEVSDPDIAFETSEEADPEDGEPEGPEDSEGELRSIVTARYIIKFEEKSLEVASFHDQWEGEHAEAEDRNAYVVEMFNALEAALVTEKEEVLSLSSFDAEGDAHEIEWLQENIDSLEEKRASLLSPVEDEAEETGDFTDDLEEEFGIGTGTESEVSPDEDLTDLEEDSFEAATSSERAVNDGDDDFSSDTNLTVVTIETDASNSEVEADVETDSVEEVREPRNVSLAELDEIEKCDELIYNWALVAKSAGAAEAKISHSVIAKDGLRRRVVGIAHLVAAWRGQDKDDSKRLNILLRYIPEGEWRLETEDHRENGIRMVNSDGDYVQVSSEMIGQPEIESGILLVHFYGPGAPEGVSFEGDNFVVTTSTLSVDKVREKMID